jgi:transposase
MVSLLDHLTSGDASMPTPTKATEARRRLIVALLGCGASRRQAAAVAGIHHTQIARWIQRGRRTPGGTFALFADLVEQAEAHPALSALPELAEPAPSAELRWALRIAEGEWRRGELAETQEEPVIIELRFDGEERTP